MLSIPEFIERSGVRGAAIKHKPLQSSHFNKEGTPLQTRLFKLKGRANCAFALGAAEWMAWRFDGLGGLPEIFDVIESQWAGLVDPACAMPWRRTGPDKPDDLVLGPESRALKYLTEQMRQCSIANTGGRVQSALYVAGIVRHVMPDKKVFDSWVETILDRFESMYKDAPADPWGPALPREAVDPDFDFKPKDSKALIQAFLTKLDPARNPYFKPVKPAK